MTAAPLLVEVTRVDHTTGKDIVESVHRGHLVVVDETGALLHAVGDAALRTYLRSTVKPFQATACLEIIGAAADDLTDQELAVGWASHVAADEHLRAVNKILARAGIDAEELTCPPVDRPDKPGSGDQRIHYNCSGKHSLFAWAGRTMGLDREVWLDRDGVLQQRVLEAIVAACGEVDGIAVDGCGAPAVHGSLLGLAQGYAGLAGDARWQRVARAGLAAPLLIGGDDRAETALLRAGVLAKPGAEGVFVAAFDTSAGRRAIAVKIEDGADRAAATAGVAAVAALGGPTVDWQHPVTGGGESQGICRATSALVDELAGVVGS